MVPPRLSKPISDGKKLRKSQPYRKDSIHSVEDLIQIFCRLFAMRTRGPGWSSWLGITPPSTLNDDGDRGLLKLAATGQILTSRLKEKMKSLCRALFAISDVATERVRA